MIVRSDGADLLLMTQGDHAALSGQILSAVRRAGWLSRPTREAVLFATHHHDDGWREEDEAPSLDPATGVPFDFMTLPVVRRQAVWPRAIARLGATSSYAAALLAQHAVTVFRRYRTDPSWRVFLDDVERSRNEYFDRAAGQDFVPSVLDPCAEDRALLLQDYAYLAWADLVSLIFCNGWTDDFEVDVYRLRGEGATVCVSPDPFAGRDVSVRVRARRVPRANCGSAEELRAALARAQFEWVSGVVAGRAVVT
jgi:hypothetical protein